jgi:hypothetical protein
MSEQQTRVRLIIPARVVMPGGRVVDGEQLAVIKRSPAIHGEHFARDGQSGDLVAMAGNGGAWVRFDGMADGQLVGCPTTWLEVFE